MWSFWDLKQRFQICTLRGVHSVRAKQGDSIRELDDDSMVERSTEHNMEARRLQYSVPKSFSLSLNGPNRSSVWPMPALLRLLCDSTLRPYGAVRAIRSMGGDINSDRPDQRDRSIMVSWTCPGF